MRENFGRMSRLVAVVLVVCMAECVPSAGAFAGLNFKLPAVPSAWSQSCHASRTTGPTLATGRDCADVDSVSAEFSRRAFLDFAAASALTLPLAAGANTAPMGADVLDRPEFRRRQDLVVEPKYTPEGGVLNIPVEVNGKNRKLKKLMGEKATLVMNIKLDDPETSRQIPALKTLVVAFAEQGLRAICVPTDQGDYEPDDSTTVRIKVQQQFGLSSSSKGPVVVADKSDLIGKFSNPLYKYLTTNAPNPNNVTRITLNYEKFLLDDKGNVLRRYPRLWGADRIEADIKAVIAGKPLPKINAQLANAWTEADKETTRSLYSFRKHYNYYDQKEAGTDWKGTKSELFVAGSVEARFKGASKGKPLNIEISD